jgi:ribosomal protein S20
MSASAESGAAKWLVSQRDRIRTYRRDYTMALFQNDTAKAEKINREFQKVYPELGKIQIKKSDITALENRRQISRLQRISKGISSSYRPLFEQVIGEASLGKMTEDIQMNGLGSLENYQNLF